ncbi:MAG: GTPase Era [Rickettsiaceae bacterium]|nr:GTPase Era [Rickettsiaceae bacterium]
MTKTATITIIGKPNAGKSTLLNQIIGQKVSIVSPKVQTTRSSIRGIYNTENVQLVFIDTPGIFTPSSSLEKAIVRSAWANISGSDFICIIIDLSNPADFDEEFKRAISYISRLDAKKIILFNKIDKFIPAADHDFSNRPILNYLRTLIRLDQKQVGEILDQEEAHKRHIDPNFINNIEDMLKLIGDYRCFILSALRNKYIDNIIEFLREQAPKGDWLYGDNDITNAPIRFLCSEITREQIFLQLSNELPYNITVEHEKWEQISENEVKIHQAIIVNKDSHKQIVLGKAGSRIKSIGQKARKEMEDNFGLKFHLFLFVKVRKDWDQKTSYLDNIGI